MKKATPKIQINELETPLPRVTGRTFLQVLGGSAYGGGTEVVLLIVRRLLKNGNRVDVVATDKVTVSLAKVRLAGGGRWQAPMR